MTRINGLTIYPSKELTARIKEVAGFNNRSVNNLILTIIKRKLKFIQPKKEDTKNNGTGQSIRSASDGNTDDGVSHELPRNEP